MLISFFSFLYEIEFSYIALILKNNADKNKKQPEII